MRAMISELRVDSCTGKLRVILLACGVLSPLALLAGRLQAQTPSAAVSHRIGGQPGDISPASVERSIATLTTGPLADRRLGTAGLTRAADYVAAEFRRIGLAVDTQRFPLPETIALNSVTVDFAVRLRARERPALGETGGTIDYEVNAPAMAVRPALDTIAQSGCIEGFAGKVAAATPALTGRQTAATARATAVGGTAVFYVPSPRTNSASREAVVRELAVNRAVVVVSDEDSATFARRWGVVGAHPPVVVQSVLERMSAPRRCAVYVTPESVARVFALAGVDLAEWRADTVPRVRTMRSVGAKIRVDAGPSPMDTVRGVNIVATLAGTDSTLRNQPPLVIVAHLDADSTSAVADDNASGVAGLLALANAFAQPGARPKRSLGEADRSGAGRAPATIDVCHGPRARDVVASAAVVGGRTATSRQLTGTEMTVTDTGEPWCSRGSER